MKAALLESGNVLVDTGRGLLELGPAHDAYLVVRQRMQAADYTAERYSRETLADLDARIAAAAADVEPTPSDAQKKTGNYRKGHVTIQGLPITIENAAGSIRSGTGKDGKPWRVTMASHYGYIKRAESAADGDNVDVFIGPNPESEIVFVVDQLKADGSFDEAKCMIGWTNEADATEAYLENYAPGWKGFGGIKALPMAAFKKWIAIREKEVPGDPRAPAAYSRCHGLSLSDLVDRIRKLGPIQGKEFLEGLGELLKKNPQLRQQIPLKDLAFIQAMAETHYERGLNPFLIPEQPQQYAKDAGGQWITIGGTKGADGKRHGGSPVFIDKAGRITKGHPGLTGKKIDALKEDDDGKEPTTAGQHRQELNRSKTYNRATWGKKARLVGIDPKSLHQLAGEILEHDRAFKGDITNMLKDARKTAEHYGEKLGGAAFHKALAQGTWDAASTPHFDEIASSLALEHPNAFAGYEGDEEARLADLLAVGNPEPMSEDDAYEQAFDVIHAHKAPVPEDEPVPFQKSGSAAARPAPSLTVEEARALLKRMMKEP